jgi:hypothetical protein
MIDGNVVAGAVTYRSLEKRDLFASEQVARLLHVGGITQFERDVMQARIGAAGEIDGVVLEPAPHEDEIFLDPVRIAETENVLIELRGPLRIGCVKRHVAQFIHDDSAHLFGRRPELPLRKQLDLPAVDIGENQRL